MNRGAARRFNAERRAVVAQLLDGGTVYAHELEAALGIKRSALNGWLRRHAPDLATQVKRRTGGRVPAEPQPVRDIQPPPPRSAPAPTAERGVNIVPADRGVLVVCGYCHRAFPRPTKRRGEQFAALHDRLHKENQ